MPETISLDDLLARQSEPTKPLATIEAIPDDPDRVVVTPYHRSAGLRRASALILRKDLLASITPTDIQHRSGDKSISIVEVVFNESLLDDIFRQLSHARADPASQFSPVAASEEVGRVGQDLSSYFWTRFSATTPMMQLPEVTGRRGYHHYSGPFQIVSVSIPPYRPTTLAFVHSVAGGIWNLRNVSSMPVVVSAIGGTGYVLRSETIYPGERIDGQWNGPQGTDRIVAEVARDLPGYPPSDIWTTARVEHDVTLRL
ncbi:MAG TPA: hypothetical protein VGD67_13025 [Pseudonocardiaceae bacterium]